MGFLGKGRGMVSWKVKRHGFLGKWREESLGR